MKVFHHTALCPLVLLAIAASVQAQDCCFEPAYRVETSTVLQPQRVQRTRVTYDTEMVEEDVVTLRPVRKTRVEQREYRVARPVTETKHREETYTVWKPVTETKYRRESYSETSYVTETSEREERVTRYKPVTETSFRNRQYQVQRPVVDTYMREQQYQVQRPVVETEYQQQQVTSLRPVTSMRSQIVDAGSFVPQQVVTPGQVQYSTRRIPTHATPGPLGLFARVRRTNVTTPYVTPPTVQTQYAYRPNYITQQVAETNYVPHTQTVQRPVQVQRMQSETVTRRVPVQVQRMQTEVVTEKIPVQTTRMVPITEVRKVPVTVRRPVTETKTREVPVQTQRWIKETRVRKVPIQTTRMVYETRTEPVTVEYVENERVVRKVRRAVRRPRYETFYETVNVPRQVVSRVPMAYSDPFYAAGSYASTWIGDSVVEYPSSAAAPGLDTPSDRVSSAKPASDPEDSPEASRVERMQSELDEARGNDEARDDSGELDLNQPEGPSASYRYESPDKANRGSSTAHGESPSDREPARARDDDTLPAPAIRGAAHRIRFTTAFLREA